MDDFRTILDELDPQAEAYVLVKAKRPNLSIQDTLKEIGVSKATFYSNFDKEARAKLDNLARAIHRDKHFRAYLKIDDHVIRAVNKLVQLMDSAKSEFVQMQSAQTIIQYALGSPLMRFEGNIKLSWRSEAIEAIQKGEIEYEPLAVELGAELARELFAQAGVPISG